MKFDQIFRQRQPHPRPRLHFRRAHLFRLVEAFEEARKLKTRYPEAAVVVFSAYDERVYAERSVRAGAAGYVMKAEPLKRFVQAIRAAARREVYRSRAMTTRIFNQAARPGEGPSFALDGLTDREMQVFQLLGKGKEACEIADQLDLSRKTIETYRRRTKEKLNLSSTADLLQHAIQWSQG